MIANCCKEGEEAVVSCHYHHSDPGDISHGGSVNPCHNLPLKPTVKCHLETLRLGVNLCWGVKEFIDAGLGMVTKWKLLSIFGIYSLCLPGSALCSGPRYNVLPENEKHGASRAPQSPQICLKMFPTSGPAFVTFPTTTIQHYEAGGTNQQYLDILHEEKFPGLFTNILTSILLKSQSIEETVTANLRAVRSVTSLHNLCKSQSHWLSVRHENRVYAGCFGIPTCPKTEADIARIWEQIVGFQHDDAQPLCEAVHKAYQVRVLKQCKALPRRAAEEVKDVLHEVCTLFPPTTCSSSITPALAMHPVTLSFSCACFETALAKAIQEGDIARHTLEASLTKSPIADDDDAKSLYKMGISGVLPNLMGQVATGITNGNIKDYKRLMKVFGQFIQEGKYLPSNIPHLGPILPAIIPQLICMWIFVVISQLLQMTHPGSIAFLPTPSTLVVAQTRHTLLSGWLPTGLLTFKALLMRCCRAVSTPVWDSDGSPEMPQAEKAVLEAGARDQLEDADGWY
ncbi:uncharacterized protein C8Q71DRAFT_728350 [Rhodofomes roseus]|uniref:Uncharacterized protein n=1 Tax=Rhodofomes roseus TaxID=34475 RepID=A0ABQ8JXT2_9APHY|nr:uncharacterized protein C8Q71DRAFT_728350 [Rhodofomes roseus]KAH9829031.1 hypothetical protein C8Q71DRAFT_728350 [Rhodofomes roseus]